MKALQQLIKEFEIFRSVSLPSEVNSRNQDEIDFGGMAADEMDFSNQEENDFSSNTGDELDQEDTLATAEPGCRYVCDMKDEPSGDTNNDSFGEIEDDEFEGSEDDSELDEPLNPEDEHGNDKEFRFFD